MPKRMDGTETWFRVKYEVAYTIRYQSYNRKWDHTKPTTGDFDGSNPMYVQHAEDTREDFYVYLGPYNSMQQLEREAKKFEKQYTDSPNSYRHLVIKRCETEKCSWEEV